MSLNIAGFLEKYISDTYRNKIPNMMYQAYKMAVDKLLTDEEMKWLRKEVFDNMELMFTELDETAELLNLGAVLVAGTDNPSLGLLANVPAGLIDIPKSNPMIGIIYGVLNRTKYDELYNLSLMEALKIYKNARPGRWASIKREATEILIRDADILYVKVAAAATESGGDVTDITGGA